MTLTTAFRSVLRELAPVGFTRVRNRLLAARGTELLQFVTVTRQQPGFCAAFATQALWIPNTSLVLQPGGHVLATTEPWAKRKPGPAMISQSAYLRGTASIPTALLDNGYVWPLDHLAVACERIAATLRDVVVPWFDSTREPAGLLALLERERWASQHHQHFAIALCHARLDRRDEARAWLERAVAGYEADLRQRPTASWCSEHIERCRSIDAAVLAGTHQELLASWAAATRAAIVGS